MLVRNGGMYDVTTAFDEIRTASVGPERDVIEAAIGSHPILRLLPDEAPGPVRDQGVPRRLGPGDTAVGRAAVAFVTKGALAAFDRKNLACVGLHGPGSVLGWEASLNVAFYPVRLMSMVDTEWVEAPARPLAELMGEEWVEHVFARHALDRLSRLQAEAACNAVHQVPHRTANLIRRLAEAVGPEVRTTQAILAEAMGVQRTSVNAAVKALERDGAIRVSRGRLMVTDADRLRRFSCGC